MKVTSTGTVFSPSPPGFSDSGNATPNALSARTPGFSTQDAFVSSSAAAASTATGGDAPQATVDDVLSGRIALVPGSTGDAVKRVQQILNIQQTGLIGPTTAAGIVAFKKRVGLTTPPELDPATIGPTTMKALLASAGASPSGPSGSAPGTGGVGTGVDDISDDARRKMNGLLEIAQNDSLTDDSAPWGRCYGAVWGYLMKAQDAQGYGNDALAGSAVPPSFAAQFGEWMNEGDNAASVGLKRLDISNPYDAPPGAIVVVGAGSPGTSSHSSHGESYATNNGVSYADYQAHPNWPGDISVATGDGVNFINDHNDETYGGSRSAWEKAAAAGNATLIGVYVPA